MRGRSVTKRQRTPPSWVCQLTNSRWQDSWLPDQAEAWEAFALVLRWVQLRLPAQFLPLASLLGKEPESEVQEAQSLVVPESCMQQAAPSGLKLQESVLSLLISTGSEWDNHSIITLMKHYMV
jgi:hypothetical protein